MTTDAIAVRESTDEALALVCNLPADSQAARRVDVFEVLASAMSAKSLADGVELSFPNTDDTASSIFGLVLAERNCCPQFHYEIVFEPNHGPLQLRVRACGEFVQQLQNLYLGLAAEAGVMIIDTPAHARS